MLGQAVGSYQIVAKIAEGGMGAVYRAQHRLIGKAAAIKVILPELSANQELVNRFFNEARAASTIHHPGIVEIYDFGYLQNGLAYIVMEYLEGEPLTRRIVARGRLDERSALAILRGAAGALAAAHAKGIIHRDLKPDNIYLVPDPDVPGGERPKLLDFGIAKLTDHHGISTGQTVSGALMGTPAYMSPEQCRGAGSVDHRSDLYAFGCILYEMLTGRTPFVAPGVGELIAAHLVTTPEPPRNLVPELSMATESLVLQLLAKRPEERVQSATELARLLGQGSMPPFAANTVSAPTPMAPTSPRVPTAPQVQMQMHPTPPPPQGAQTPTTLSSAARGADEPPVERRSRAGLYAAIGAFAVVGGVVAVVLAAGGGEQRPARPEPQPQVAAPSAIDAGAAAVAPSIDAAPAVVAGAAIDAGAAATGSAPGSGAGSTTTTTTTTSTATGAGKTASGTSGTGGAGKTASGTGGAGKTAGGAGKTSTSTSTSTSGGTGAGSAAGKTNPGTGSGTRPGSSGGSGKGSSTIVPIETEI